MLSLKATIWLAVYICVPRTPLVGVVNGKDPFGLTALSKMNIQLSLHDQESFMRTDRNQNGVEAMLCYHILL
jgi:hypothetical protein